MKKDRTKWAIPLGVFLFLLVVAILIVNSVFTNKTSSLETQISSNTQTIGLLSLKIENLSNALSNLNGRINETYLTKNLTIGKDDVNPEEIQLRVHGECQESAAIRKINEDGSVICVGLPNGSSDFGLSDILNNSDDAGNHDIKNVGTIYADKLCLDSKCYTSFPEQKDYEVIKSGEISINALSGSDSKVLGNWDICYLSAAQMFQGSDSRCRVLYTEDDGWVISGFKAVCNAFCFNISET